MRIFFLSVFVLLGLVLSANASACTKGVDCPVTPPPIITPVPSPTPPPPAQLTNESVATDGLLYASIDAGRAYWAAHGIYAPIVPICMFDATDLNVAAVTTETLPIRICWNRTWAAAYRAGIASGTLTQRRLWYAEGCTAAAHEEGHVIGFGHVDGTIMQEKNPPIPPECSAWAVTKTPVSRQVIGVASKKKMKHKHVVRHG